jgi:hypothetical protein
LFSPHLSSKSPSPQRDEALKKKRERKSIEKREEGKKEKLQESLQIKRESQYFERRKYFNIKIFLRESIFSPSIIPFQKAFSKSF